MSDFNEFDQQGTVPEKETGSIISHAFEMYKGVFLYALLTAAIYMVGSWLVQLISGFDSMSLADAIRDSGGYGKINYLSIPGLTSYYAFSGLFGILAAPLYVGLIYITNKFNNKEQIQISDLFIGYRQNFVNILLYSLLSGVILVIAFSLCIIPGFFVAPLLLLGYPVLLFENANVAEALSKSFNVAKENYGTFLGASFLGMLISLAGIIICGIGIIATMYFYVIVMYSAYVAFLGKPRQLIKQ